MLKTAARECKKKNIKPDLSWKHRTVSDHCEDTPPTLTNQSEGSAVCITFRSYCTRSSLLVDIVCVVYVFLVLFVLSVYVRRTFWVPLISSSSWVFVSRSCCPAGRSAPCRGRCWASGPLWARWWGSRGLSGGGGAQQGGEERAEQKCQAQCECAGTVALFASVAARLLAQNTLKVRRTATALILNARPPVLAQE